MADEESNLIVCGLVGTHVLDPKGDVTLLLSSKNAIVSGSSELDLVTAQDWNAILEAQSEQDSSEADPNYEEADTNQNQVSTNKNEANSHAPDRGESDDSKEGESDDSNERESDDSNEEELAIFEIPHKNRSRYKLGVDDVRFQVSSRHLSLVSTHFDAMLSPKFREGSLLQQRGLAEISLQDDPCHAMKVILQSLHYHHKTPGITPSLMMQIAWTVDKYDLAVPMRYWIRQWFKQIRGRMPDKWTPDVINWLGMFTMLKFESEAKRMRKLLASNVTETTSCGDLPIQGIIDTMQSDRLKHLQKAFEKIEATIDSYWPSQERRKVCQQEAMGCDETVLGSLLKGLKLQDLWPLPRGPFCGLTICDVINKLKSIKLYSLCSDKPIDYYSKRRGPSRKEACKDGVLSDTIAELQKLTSQGGPVHPGTEE